MIGRRLVADFPYIEAEVKYAIHKEYARTAVDVIGRRTRLAFQNVQAAHEALPRVVEIMQKELKWSKKEKEVRSTTGWQCLPNGEKLSLMFLPYMVIVCVRVCVCACVHVFVCVSCHMSCPTYVFSLQILCLLIRLRLLRRSSILRAWGTWQGRR